MAEQIHAHPEQPVSGLTASNSRDTEEERQPQTRRPAKLEDNQQDTMRGSSSLRNRQYRTAQASGVFTGTQASSPGQNDVEGLAPGSPKYITYLQSCTSQS